jgi:3'(2'), 5'-bisphosphate nucleotidase
MANFQNLLKISIDAAIRAGEKTLDFFDKEITVETKEDNSPLTKADLESNRIINEMLQPTGIPILSEENKIIPYEIRKFWDLFWLVDPLDGTKEFINKSPEYTVNIALIENNSPVIGVIYVPAKQVLYYATHHSGAFKVDITGSLPYELILKNSVQLPLRQQLGAKTYIIASKSHMSEETLTFIETLKKNGMDCELVSIGSSLKFCLMAEGSADIYPRFGRTMEWDTAAGQVIAEATNCRIIDTDRGLFIKYNKEELYNPSFIAYKEDFKEMIHKIIL